MNRNMRLPLTAAPSEDGAKNKRLKKKPPPRPPPPNFNKFKSESAWNLPSQFDGLSLIDLSPPVSPKRTYGGSVSSSFSSSTSSLASSKRSFDYETENVWGAHSKFYTSPNVPAPTIIRPQASKRNGAAKPKVDEKLLLPMPSVPPPSPPKECEEVEVPYGIALYDYDGGHKEDLSFKVNEIIFLLRRLNADWFFGRIEDREGLFPANHISIQVPLTDQDDKLVTALFEFIPQAVGDLHLKPGETILVTGKVSADWLIGECNGRRGQFPANFVDRIPSTIN